MSEAQKVEAHVCFNGMGWQTYIGAKPEGMNCEFEDHRTCLEAAERLQKIEDGKCLEVKEIEAARRARLIEAAAEEATAKADRDLLVRAGWLKSQALREVGMAWDAAQKKVTAEAAEDIAEAEAMRKAHIAEIEEDAQDALNDLAVRRAEMEADIAATDWEAKARAEKHEGSEALARG